MNAKQKAKVEKTLPDFIDAINPLSVDELKARILTYVGERENVLESKEANEEIRRVADLKKELEGPYKDTLSAIDLKIKYLRHMIQEKGSDL